MSDLKLVATFPAARPDATSECLRVLDLMRKAVEAGQVDRLLCVGFTSTGAFQFEVTGNLRMSNCATATAILQHRTNALLDESPIVPYPVDKP